MALKLKSIMVGFAAALAGTAVADVQKVGNINWSYDTDDDVHACLYGGYKIAAIDVETSGDITIPSVLGGMPVTRVEEYAFYNCEKLQHVTIPSIVTGIGDDAFISCGLTGVTIPSSVKSIGNSAFSHSGLTEVTIPSSVTKLGEGVFSGCSSLESVSLPTPRTAPTLSGYTFGGYYDTLAVDEKGNAKGKQYYDGSMKSVRSWDKKAATTLWAKWTNKVTFGKNGGTGGDNYVTCTKGQPMPKRTMPTKSGYKFGGYYVSASSKTGQCYNADGTGTSSMKWSTGGTPTIWALWTKMSSFVEVTPPNAAPAAAEPILVPAGLYSGVLADGSGTFCLMLDEAEDGSARTAFIYVASEDGVFTAECTVEESDGVLLLESDDGADYFIDPAAWILRTFR